MFTQKLLVEDAGAMSAKHSVEAEAKAELKLS